MELVSLSELRISALPSSRALSELKSDLTKFEETFGAKNIGLTEITPSTNHRGYYRCWENFRRECPLVVYLDGAKFSTTLKRRFWNEVLETPIIKFFPRKIFFHRV